MAELSCMPVFTDSMLADTLHLDATEFGAYMALIFSAWRAPECALPDDDAKLARYAKCTTKMWRRVRRTVAEFWTISDGTWVHEQVSRDHAQAKSRRLKRSHAGLSRWAMSAPKSEANSLENNDESYACASALHQHCTSNALLNLNLNNEQKQKDTPPYGPPQGGETRRGDQEKFDMPDGGDLIPGRSAPVEHMPAPPPAHPVAEPPASASVAPSEPLATQPDAQPAVAPQPQSAKPARKPRARADRGTGLPDDWTLPDDWRAWAESRGLVVGIGREAEKFLRYWTSPDCRAPLKKDWFRTWQNWVDNCIDRLKSAPHAGINGAMARAGVKSANPDDPYGDFKGII